jgi:hypothetical protein
MNAPGSQQRQLHIITRDQRQSGIRPSVDNLTQQRGLGLQHRSRSGHFDRRLDITDLKLEIQLGNLVHLQRDVGLRGRLEAGVLHLHVVRPNQKVLEIEVAVRVRRGGVLDTALHGCGGDLGVRNGGARWIRDPSGDGCRYLLAPSHGQAHHRNKQRQNEPSKWNSAFHKTSSNCLQPDQTQKRKLTGVSLRTSLAPLIP